MLTLYRSIESICIAIIVYRRFYVTFENRFFPLINLILNKLAYGFDDSNDDIAIYRIFSSSRFYFTFIPACRFDSRARHAIYGIVMVLA